MSETLGEEEGNEEVAKEEDAGDEADQVLRTHSRSTPFRTRRARTKNRPVRARYKTSSMSVLLGRLEDGTGEGRQRNDRDGQTRRA
jgi:hypothetical protein